jgi:hypothetical protein
MGSQFGGVPVVPSGHSPGGSGSILGRSQTAKGGHIGSQSGGVPVVPSGHGYGVQKGGFPSYPAGHSSSSSSSSIPLTCILLSLRILANLSTFCFENTMTFP